LPAKRPPDARYDNPAPNDASEHVELWRELADSLPKDCRWIILGHWNFVVKRRDKSISSGQLISEREKLVFNHLTEALQIKDTFPSSNRICYNWDNRRQNGIRVLARLDRVYVFKAGAGGEILGEYEIMADSNHFDHLPVRRKIPLQTETRRKSSYKMSACYLNETTVIQRIGDIWRSHSQLPFFGKLCKCVKFYKSYCVEQAIASRASEKELREALSTTIGDLYRDPADETTQATLSGLAKKLETFERLKAEGSRLRSRIKWKQVGDTCSRKFFSANRERSTASHITALEDQNGLLHTDQMTMETIASKFYGDLYSAPTRTTAEDEALVKALSSIGNRFTRDMKESLNASIIMPELEAAFKEMQAGKAPGPDGIIVEFYKLFWELIGGEFLEMLNSSIAQGRLPPGIYWLSFIRLVTAPS
jgi:hypothetical protein